MDRMKHFKAIVIGVSAGGLRALSEILSALPREFPVPVIIVQHRGSSSRPRLEEILNQRAAITVVQADEKARPEAGRVYLAPDNYHLLIERDQSFSLSVDERVNYSRPSIDVLFESASEVYLDRLIGVILTGASHDGSRGLKKIHSLGGYTIVQSPESADSRTMPQAAICASDPDEIVDLHEIADRLIALCPKARNSKDSENRS